MNVVEPTMKRLEKIFKDSLTPESAFKRLLLYIPCVLSAFIYFTACSSSPIMQWHKTVEGYYIWADQKDAALIYSWNGFSVSGVANGHGVLTISDSNGILKQNAIDLRYGALSSDYKSTTNGQSYIGATNDGLLSGFAVLIDNDKVYIGNFINSLPDGTLDLYKNGNIYYSGNWSSGVISGQGILYSDKRTKLEGFWENGKLINTDTVVETHLGRYEGHIKHNTLSGLGTMYYKGGEIYKGNWKDGTQNGFGDFSSKYFSYIGDWENGLPDGTGLAEFSDGSYYDGKWIKGKRSGYGDSHFPNGDFYSGDWNDDTFNGEGTYISEDGFEYNGLWKEGLQHGFGQYSYNGFDYTGNWEDGWINGEGIAYYPNGDRYEGNFVENLRYGLGYYSFANGNTYEGEFVDDTFNGLGVFTFSDGSVYEGEFKNGKICGDGTYYYADEDGPMAITANFDGSNTFPNYASILFSNGDIYEGELINGKPTENGIWTTEEQNSPIRDAMNCANEFYKLHKKQIDKAVIVISLALTVVAIVASKGTAVPAFAAAGFNAQKVANVANVANDVINYCDIATSVGSAAIDDDWNGVATEVAINVALIGAPRFGSKIVAKPARKLMVKLSTSALGTTIQKSAIQFTKTKPFKKVTSIVKDATGKLTKGTEKASTKLLKNFSKSKAGKHLTERNIARQAVKNKKLVSKVCSKLGIGDVLQKKLLDEMVSNKDLAKLIRQNPEFNIGRWLNTQRKVDKKLLSKVARNTQYAGKNFYFHPALNKNVDNYLKQSGKFSGYTREELLELDRLFPNGVPYTKQGFPDFIKAGACKKDDKGNLIKIVMPEGHFTGDRTQDFRIAREEFRKKYGYSVDEYGYTWHHLEGNPPTMVLVNTHVHETCRHAGGHALAKQTQNSSSALMLEEKATIIRKQAGNYKNAKTISEKSDYLNNIKNNLDNLPESPEKQKLFNDLPEDVKRQLDKMWGADCKYRLLPAEGPQKGYWVGEKGNSTYMIDETRVPKNDGVKNLHNMSMKQIITENNLENGIVFRNGYPDFRPVSKGTVEIDFEPYRDDILKNERKNLHEAAFAEYAKKTGISVDEARVYKGDSEPVERLAKKWQCSEEEVWIRCNNPHHNQLVWHEEPDCKTLRLIPIEVHANIDHIGGISIAKIIYTK